MADINIDNLQSATSFDSSNWYESSFTPFVPNDMALYPPADGGGAKEDQEEENIYDDEDLNRIMRVSKPDIAQNSIDLYIKNLRLFAKRSPKVLQSSLDDKPIQDFDFLIPTQDYNPKDLIKDLPLPTQRNYYNAILPIIKSFEKYPEKWGYPISREEVEKYYGEEISKLNKQTKENADKDIISEAKKEKYSVNFEQIIKLIPKLKKQKQFQDALILSLMVEYKFRNEIATLKLIKDINYDELSDEEKKDNNYVVMKTDGDIFISRGAYKTDGKYGVIISKVDNPVLKQDLIQYISKMNDDIFFKNTKGIQYSQGDISTRLGRVTKKELGVKLGTSSITKLFMSSLDKDTLNALKKLSESRGTSINVLLASYFNNI